MVWAHGGRAGGNHSSNAITMHGKENGQIVIAKLRAPQQEGEAGGGSTVMVESQLLSIIFWKTFWKRGERDVQLADW